MAARRAGQKVIDWTKISAALPEEVRGDFLAFRGRYEAAKIKMNSYSATPEPIDWSYYKSNIAKSGMVEKFQKQYEALQIPYPPDIASSQIAEKQKDINVQSTEAIKVSKEEALRLQGELEKIQAEKPYEEMTIDEYLDQNPGIREKANSDMRKHIWYIPKE